MTEHDQVCPYVEQDMDLGRRKTPRRIYAGDKKEALKREANRDLAKRDQKLSMEDAIDMFDLSQFLLNGTLPRSDRLELRVVEKPK